MDEQSLEGRDLNQENGVLMLLAFQVCPTHSLALVTADPGLGGSTYATRPLMGLRRNYRIRADPKK